METKWPFQWLVIKLLHAILYRLSHATPAPSFVEPSKYELDILIEAEKWLVENRP